MKVLLVDDEIFTIRMLQNLIHWKEMGLELIGYAQNGEDAYAKTIEENPDIIISDIKMPGMNGLEFVKKVKAYNKGIKIILMSVYADFSYVQEGIRLKCSDYILKPIDESDLEKVLRKLIMEIQGEKERQTIISESANQLDKMNMFHFMKTGHGINKIKNAGQTELIKRMTMQKYSVFMVQISNATIDEYNKTTNIEMVHEGYICSVLGNTLLSMEAEYRIFDYEENSWTIILEGKNGFKREEIARRLIDAMWEETGLKVNVCFSSFGHQLEELPELYEELRNLSKYSFYIGDMDILGYEYNCNKEELKEVRDIGITKDIEQAVNNKEVEKIYTILNEAFELSKEHYPGELTNIYELCYQTLLSVRKQIPEKERGSEKYRELFGMSYEKLKKIPSLKELKTEIMRMVGYIPNITAVSASVGKIKQNTYSEPVKESIVLIEQKYNENLSLDEICEEIAVSKNYFCYLFKRETGRSVWNYLTEIRLEHAKQLLEDTDLRSYEVAFQVGYDNPSYFSKLFKKYENMTPNEYRETRK